MTALIDDQETADKSHSIAMPGGHMTNSVAQAFWDRDGARVFERPLRYWQHRYLCSLVDAVATRTTGSPNEREMVSSRASKTRFSRAVSIGCGTAENEISYVRDELIDRLVLVELSPNQLSRAREIAVREGVSDRVETVIGGIQEASRYAPFDLVYWRKSLHHMPNCKEAIRWSVDSLSCGGRLFLNEYVGPNRLQMTTQMQAAGANVRKALDKKYLAVAGGYAPITPDFPSVDHWLKTDPTEAADSESILPGILKFAPGAKVYYQGGVVYHYALNDIIGNFSETSPEDRSILGSLMLYDEALSRQGLNHFAIVTYDK